MRVKSEILQRLLGTGNEASQRSERFGERSINKRHAVFHSELFRRPAPMLATCQRGMRFINKNARAMRFRNSKQFRQVPKIAVHRIDTLYNHKLAPPFLTAQRGIKRGCVIML